MDSLKLARIIRRAGAVAHFFGILAGASAAFNLWQQIGRYISYHAPLGWGGLLYRLFLCFVFVGGGLALGRWAERLSAQGDAERAAAAQAEREEADRLTRQVVTPRRRGPNAR